ncbi:MAG: hypothetical protein V3V74_07395 [Nitrosomonadaceae bacterium]
MKTKQDNPRRSEMVGMDKAMEMLSCTHQHIRNLVIKHKRVREYVFGAHTIIYNKKDIEEERKRKS